METIQPPFDPRYRGIFRMLYIAAWVFAAMFIIAGTVPLYGLYYDVPALRATAGQGVDPGLDHALRVLVPGALLGIGMILLLAGCFGRADSELGRSFLLLAAMLIIVVRLCAFAVMSYTTISHPARGTGPPWRTVLGSTPTLVSSMVYPLLCMVTIYASRQREDYDAKSRQSEI